MPHDPTKALLGTTGSSDRTATKEEADPTVYLPGYAVRRANDGTLSFLATAGKFAGVSLGHSLSSTTKTSVCREGLDVPIRLALGLVKNDLTFMSRLSGGTALQIEFLDTGTAGSEAVSFASGKISVSMEDGVSTATQLKTALDGSANSNTRIEVAIASGQGAVAQAAFAVDDIDNSPAVLGAAVRVSDFTGMACAAGGTVSNAIYRSAQLDGVEPIGSTVVPVALIDMGGGL